MARTKGGIIIEEINIGDIHYEFEHGLGVKSEVIIKPEKDEENVWVWKSKNVNTGKEIDYLIKEGFECYGPNLYDYEAYNVENWI